MKPIHGYAVEGIPVVFDGTGKAQGLDFVGPGGLHSRAIIVTRAPEAEIIVMDDVGVSGAVVYI